MDGSLYERTNQKNCRSRVLDGYSVRSITDMIRFHKRGGLALVAHPHPYSRRRRDN